MRLVALGSLVALLLAGPALGAEIVKMGDLPAISNAGLYVAIEKGYFAEKAITVEPERFASGAKMTPALATGQLDVAIGTPAASLFNSIASGMDFRIVADKGQVRPGFSFSPIIVRKDLVGVVSAPGDQGRVRGCRDLRAPGRGDDLGVAMDRAPHVSLGAAVSRATL